MSTCKCAIVCDNIEEYKEYANRYVQDFYDYTTYENDSEIEELPLDSTIEDIKKIGIGFVRFGCNFIDIDDFVEDGKYETALIKMVSRTIEYAKMYEHKVFYASVHC